MSLRDGKRSLGHWSPSGSVGRGCGSATISPALDWIWVNLRSIGQMSSWGRTSRVHSAIAVTDSFPPFGPNAFSPPVELVRGIRKSWSSILFTTDCSLIGVAATSTRHVSSLAITSSATALIECIDGKISDTSSGRGTCWWNTNAKWWNALWFGFIRSSYSRLPTIGPISFS